MLRDRHRKSVEAGKTAATRKGDLEVALAWEELQKEIDPPPVDLAKAARITVSGRIPEHPMETLVDGVLSSEADAHRYWFAGPRPATQWVRLDLAEVRLIRMVRLHVPAGVSWHRNGHEPLDYDLLLRNAGKVVKRWSVRDGAHPRRHPSADGKTQRIDLDLKAGVESSQVELAFTRTSGRNLAPVIFEIEVLGEE
jgi:hypothetical protein